MSCLGFRAQAQYCKLCCNHLLPEAYFSRLKGLVFDCDGVLVDSKRANLEFYNRLRLALDLSVMTPDQERYVHSHTIAQSLARILPAGSKEQAEEVRSKIDYSDLLSFVRVQPGLEFVLQLLKQRGVRLAVNTNRTDTMGLILREFDLERYFFPIVTSSRVTWAKPHPESLNYILDTWTLGPEEVAYIGDSWVDAQTAKSAGVPFWAFGDPSLEADLFVPDFDCLGQVLALKLPRPDNP